MYSETKINNYDLGITTTAGALTPKQYAEYKKDFYNKPKNYSNELKDDNATEKICPFKNSVSVDCKKDCALYVNGCNLVNLLGVGTKDTKGAPCPIRHIKCNENCGLYNSGCVLTGKVTK